MAAGMGVPRIQQVSGVTKGVLIRLVYGCPGRGEPPSRKIRPGNAAKLLALRAPVLADSALIDATGTRRRLQALVAVGWSGAELMRRIGVLGTDFPKLLDRDRVLVRTDRAVRALYEELWDTPPPASTRWERATRSRALAFAAAHGWVPPLAWDDDTIDDPDAAPDHHQAEDAGLVDEVAVERVLRGDGNHRTLNHAERVELARRTAAAGLGTTAISRALRCSGATARRLLAEAGGAA
jgi:hypothetical protein